MDGLCSLSFCCPAILMEKEITKEIVYMKTDNKIVIEIPIKTGYLKYPLEEALNQYFLPQIFQTFTFSV